MKPLFKKYGLYCLLLCLPAWAWAQPGWKVEDYSIHFKIKNAGFYVDGTLNDLEASIAFDPATLKGKIEASVGVATINTDNRTRDKHLLSADYFDATRFPRIYMKSYDFKRAKSGNYIGYFYLTIKDVTRQVTVPFKFDGKTFDGYLEINRRDFGVGDKSWILSDMVKVFIRVDVSRLKN
ncbi:YceI family protein [Thermonema rossianum]|uniref:YceI family protein n=1 Tax=Thermonema rossianum TaxID=55505 RepID=UPI000689B1A6|nr:YceI family protein [Thermonema rossianum]